MNMAEKLLDCAGWPVFRHTVISISQLQILKMCLICNYHITRSLRSECLAIAYDRNELIKAK